MDLLTMIAGLAGMALTGMIILIAEMARKHRYKRKHHYAISTTPPVVKQEITQQVRGRRSARPVIRNTQLRGKPRRKF